MKISMVHMALASAVMVVVVGCGPPKERGCQPRVCRQDMAPVSGPAVRTTEVEVEVEFIYGQPARVIRQRHRSSAPQGEYHSEDVEPSVPPPSLRPPPVEKQQSSLNGNKPFKYDIPVYVIAGPGYYYEQPIETYHYVTPRQELYWQSDTKYMYGGGSRYRHHGSHHRH